MNKKKGILRGCGLPAGNRGGHRGDIGLGNGAGAMVAGSRECGVWWQGLESVQGLESWPRKAGPGGQTRGPSPWS